MLFPTTIAGSLPKPEWLAEPNTLWAPWKSKGEELARAKRDATLLAVKLQEDAGIDMVSCTGSGRAGAQVTRDAADTVKRVGLELGGKSANIVLDDADPAAAQYEHGHDPRET